MHHKKVIHMDLKASNIYLNNQKEAKIGDFGWSTLEGELSLRESLMGEQHHMAPETFDAK